MLVLPVQVGVLLREFSIGDLESVDLSLEGSLLGPEGLVLGGEVGILLGEGSIVVLQLAVPLGEVLDNDLGLEREICRRVSNFTRHCGGQFGRVL